MNRDVSLLAIYRSPSYRDLTPFFNSLETTVRNTKPKLCTIVAGDININISSHTPSEISERYLCLLAELNLFPAVTKPTRGGSCLDHIHVTSNFPVVTVVCRSDITDHDISIAGITTKPTIHKENLKRLVTKLDYNSIEHNLEKIDWSVVIGGRDVDSATEAFTDTLTHIIEKNTKHIHVSRSKFVLKPWMTPGLLRCSKHRDYLHSQVRNNPTDDTTKKIYLRYRNFHNNLLRKLKQQHDSLELEQNKGNPKKLWQSIRQITYTHKSRKSCPELTASRENVADSLNYCNEFFTSVGQSLAEQVLSQTSETQESLTAKVKLKNSPPQSFFLKPTDESEIEAIIMTQKSDCAPGTDGITNRLLKRIKKHIIIPLTHICNFSISEGVFPEKWKKAVITPIHKTGKKADPGNYRPISLLGSFSKILERVVHRRIVHYIESYHLISNAQFGFRQGKSTEDAVLNLTNTVASNLDGKRACIGVFLDLAKAFDTVSIPILLRKLELLGFRGQSLQWFKSYLTGRSQYVKVDGHQSDSRAINYGVPQGSILGPTLFTLYINDLMYLDLKNATTICYADDTAILFYGNTWQQVRNQTEKGLTKVAGWLRDNLLTLNASKTKFLCFHKTGVSAPPLNLNIKVHKCKDTAPCDCVNIERTATIKYLGVVLDERLTFKDHLMISAKRIRQFIYLFKNLRSAADIKLLREVYIAVCQPVISYCITSWGGSGISNMIQLERAQRAILKVVLGKPIGYPTAQIYSETKLLNVRGLFIIRVITRMHRNIRTIKDFDEIVRKRVFALPIPKTNTNFARRFGFYLHPHLYNKVNRQCNILDYTVKEAKSKVEGWLMNLNYSDIETALRGYT